MTREPPIKCCQSCFAVQFATHKICVSCGYPLGDPLKAWDIISRNEREIEIDGKVYFACRCNPSSLWTIEENTARVSSGTVKLVSIVSSGLTTRDVTAYFSRKAKAEEAAALAAWNGGCA